MTNDNLAVIYGTTWQEGFNYVLSVDQAADIQHTVRRLYNKIEEIWPYIRHKTDCLYMTKHGCDCGFNDITLKLE